MKIPNYKVPFWYIGSKSYISSWIVDHLPEHRCYVIVFGGTAATLWAKERSAYEVYNDLDDDVYSFFIALRDHQDELVEYLRLCPASRKLVQEWSRADTTKMSLIEKAARLYVLTMLSFSGKKGTGSFPVRQGFRSDQDYRNWGKIQTFVMKIETLKKFARRLQLVAIEKLDFRELIKRYDSPVACFYADPPYIDLNHYDLPFYEKDHRDLADLAHTIQGKIIISYYKHPLIGELYSDCRWYFTERYVTKQAQKGRGAPKKTATEILIMNYDPHRDSFRPVGQTAMDTFWR